MQNKKLEQERLENIKLNRDLELASEIQKLLIPTNLPKADKFSVSAIYKPQNKIGDDYYDVIKISNENISSVWLIFLAKEYQQLLSWQTFRLF